MATLSFATAGRTYRTTLDLVEHDSPVAETLLELRQRKCLSCGTVHVRHGPKDFIGDKPHAPAIRHKTHACEDVAEHRAGSPLKRG